MAKLTKKAKLIKAKIDATKQYSVVEAVALLKELAQQNSVKLLMSV